jgi:hypothetical protein
MIDDQTTKIELDTPSPSTNRPQRSTHWRRPSSTGPVNGHEAGFQSALAVSTRADAEPRLRASAEKAADSVADLLLRIGDGDAAAWDEIFRRYGGLVSTTVRSFRLQEADALDAVQMTWLRLAENAHRVQFPERLGGGWRTRHVANVCSSCAKPGPSQASPM